MRIPAKSIIKVNSCKPSVQYVLAGNPLMDTVAIWQLINFTLAHTRQFY